MKRVWKDVEVFHLECKKPYIPLLESQSLERLAWIGHSMQLAGLVLVMEISTGFGGKHYFIITRVEIKL